MKLFFLLLLSCLATGTRAATYYFSSSQGDDNRSAVEAQDPTTPFKSIEKLNSFTLALKPGDSILFRRGDVFYGSLVVKAVGTAAANVYYGAYGAGPEPVITGFTTLTNWTLHNGSVYWTTLDAGPMLNIVTVNGEAKGMGRYPNSGYLTYENINNNPGIIDNDLPASPSWTGAEIVIRKYRFILDRHKVTSHSGGTLTYSPFNSNGDSSVFLPVKGNGYFFQNHLATLDQAGEWFYDVAAKRLYMHFGGNPPSGFVVKASTKDYNGFVTTAKFLTFENLRFEGGNNKGLWLTSTTNTTIRNCHFYNQGGYSLHAVDVNAITVKGGSVNTSFSNGIFFENNTNNCLIDGVSVDHSNSIPGTARSSTSMSVGITVNGDGNRIVNNQVRNSGYNGIAFNGDNVLIERNLVDTFCTLKDDGGGIYCYVGGSNANASNRIIRSNIIVNAVGAFAGAESYDYEKFGKAAGIYLDEHSNNIEITDNTVANGDWGGIFLHNAHDCNISRNVIYNHRHQVLVSQYTAQTRNILMKQNQYVARTPTQETFFYRSFVFDTPAAMGTFDSNIYARPLDDNKSIHLDNFWTGGNGTLYLSLAQWKTAYGLDPSSQKSPLTFTANLDDSIRFDYNATPAPKIIALSGSYLDLKGAPYAGSFALEPFTGSVLLKSRVAFMPGQVIIFPAVPAKTLGDAPFTLLATATSGLPVSYRIVSGPATVNGDLLTLTGAGTVEIEASQEGNAGFKAAPPVRQSFVVELPKIAQQISFPPIGNKTFGDAPFLVSATASSGLPVSYVVTGPAIMNGDLLTLTGAGTVTVQALQAGNSRFLAAPAVSQSFSVAKSNQVITFPPISRKFDTDLSFTLVATTTSALPVSYRIQSGPATVAANKITLTGTGYVTVEALQPGNGNYHPAAAVQQTFVVELEKKRSQSIIFPAITNKNIGEPPFALAAVASSGLQVSYQVLSGPATVNGKMVTVTGEGEVWIEASQPGNFDYNASPSTSQNFMVTAVAKLPQSISFPIIQAKTYGDAPFVLNATTSSGLPVSYKVVGGPATLAGNLLSLNGAGFVTIEASQAGNSIYNAAVTVSQGFVVNKKPQAITFPAILNKVYGDAPFVLNATTSSGLPITYKVTSGAATVMGNTAVATGTGMVWIEASQPGDDNYQMAGSTSRNFAVANAVDGSSRRYEWICPSSTKSLFATAAISGSTYQWQVDKNDRAGFVALSNSAFYTGASTPTLTLVNAPSSTNGFRYRCQVITGQTMMYSPETVVQFYTVWTGAINNAWGNGGNWSCGLVPDGSTHVFIPQVATTGPVVQQNAACRSVTMGSDATLHVKEGYRLTVTGVAY